MQNQKQIRFLFIIFDFSFKLFQSSSVGSSVFMQRHQYICDKLKLVNVKAGF